MKKFLLLILLLLNFSYTYSQLSGTKIIGSAPSDYLTFTSAVSALNSQGINGDVEFLVKPGVYNEKISINQINGAGPNAGITFKSQTGDSTSVILQAPSSSTATNNYVILFNGADYVNFKRITIKRTDTLNYANVIDMKLGSKRNSFTGCIIEGSSKKTTSTFKSLVTSDNVGKESYNIFFNNIFRNGDYGIYFLGQGSTLPDSSNVIINNKFINQAYKGLYFTSQYRLVIRSNEITSNSMNTSYNAIYVQYSNDTMRVVKNKIVITAGIGIQIHNCNESNAQKGLTANNFISVGGVSTAYGLYINLSKHQDVYYNSINVYSSSATSNAALYITGSATEYINLKNNIFADNGNGYACYVNSDVPALGIQASDYNDIFSSGGNYCFWKSAGNIPSLANWVSASGLDNHSVNTNPMFYSSVDLHSYSPVLNAAATTNILPVFITDDIDGQLRNTSTPDIGADEFNLDNLGVSKIIFQNQGFCSFENFSVSVRIKNYSPVTYQGSIPVFYRINGFPAVNEIISSVNLLPGDSMVYNFSNIENFVVSGSYSISSGTKVVQDIQPANDSVMSVLQIFSLPAAEAGPNQEICHGSSVTLTASGGISYIWNTNPPTQGASIIVTPLVVTDYSVTVYSAEGCSAVSSVTVTPVILPQPVAGFNYSATGLQINFTNVSQNADQFLWSFGDGNTSATENPVHNYISSGNYAVKLKSSNLCFSDSVTQQLNVVGIADIEIPAIFIYPNPFTDKLFINTKRHAFSIIIYDLTGKLIWHNNKEIPDEDLYELKTEFFKPGNYLIEFETEHQLYRYKVIKI